MHGTILIIAQHPQLRQSLRDWVAMHLPWCRVVAAEDVPTAIDIVRNDSIQVIIMDMDRNQENGIALLEEIRDSTAGAALVALGLPETPAHRAAATAAGAAAYVPKSRLQTELISILLGAEGLGGKKYA